MAEDVATNSTALACAVGQRLLEAQMTLSVAESCTGGLLSRYMTDVAGSSAYFVGGVVAYANAVKVSILGVPQSTLDAHGAVSEQTAMAMATGVRQRLQTDLGVATTGIAGPGGGSPEKPVGLVYIALSTASFEECRHFFWNGSREQNRQSAACAAMQMLLERLSVGRSN